MTLIALFSAKLDVQQTDAEVWSVGHFGHANVVCNDYCIDTVSLLLHTQQGFY